MSGEMEGAMRAAEEAWRRKWRERGDEEEPTLHYVVGFDCTPSAFEQIKRAIAAQRTCNRTFRHYPVSGRGEGA